MEGEVVEAEGMAPNRADDLPGTKAAALAAAQRSAVELVVGVYVNAKTRVEKAALVEQSILTKTAGYVKRYEILSEGRSGEWYKMRIRALVSTKDLHEDLDSAGLLRAQALGYPRVTVLLQEFVLEKQIREGYAARALTQALLDQGFKVIELPRSINREEDPLEIARNLSRNSTDILVAGFARAQPMDFDKKMGGMASYRASVTFRVISAGSGEVIQTVSQTASGLEGTPEIAAQKALEKAAEMTSKDLARLPEEMSKRAQVDVTITGLTSFEALSQYQKALSGMQGVKDHYLRSYNQSTGVAVLDVLADNISPQDLADRSVKAGGSAWSVFQVAGRTIQLSASQAGR